MTNRGFLALTVTVILIVVFILVVVVFIRPGLATYPLILIDQKNTRSKVLAQSCADIVLLKILVNPSYQGNETLTFSEGEYCNIYPVENVGSGSNQQKIIRIRANFKDFFSYLKVIFSPSNKKIVSWQFEKSF
ncbi:MAG: hypothetical protein NZ822_03190 [Patescibacteria group bacterium]|nr:hypothetical protein [Patescibacteria group bacterium]